MRVPARTVCGPSLVDSRIRGCDIMSLDFKETFCDRSQGLIEPRIISLRIQAVPLKGWKPCTH